MIDFGVEWLGGLRTARGRVEFLFYFSFLTLFLLGAVLSIEEDWRSKIAAKVFFLLWALALITLLQVPVALGAVMLASGLVLLALAALLSTHAGRTFVQSIRDGNRIGILCGLVSIAAGLLSVFSTNLRPYCCACCVGGLIGETLCGSAAPILARTRHWRRLGPFAIIWAYVALLVVPFAIPGVQAVQSALLVLGIFMGIRGMTFRVA